MFKSLNGGLLPQHATKYSAGFDVFANEDVVIGAGETKVIGLGICLDDESIINRLSELRENNEIVGGRDNPISAISKSHYFELHPRSSLRAKGLGGGVGIIDMDYRDEIKMIITNLFNPHICAGADCIPLISTTPYEIKRGDKIGQLLLKRHEGFLLPTEYTKDEERTGGFGSTDNKIDEKNVNASKMMGIIK